MNIKNLTIVAGAAVALAMTAGLATKSAYATDGAATSTVTVVAPLTISETQGIVFGSIAPSAAAGTATLDTSDGLTVSAALEALTGTAPKSGAFDLTGEGTSNYSISLPTSVTMTSGGDSMTLNGFGHSAGGTPSLSGGTGSFTVGAVLNVDANQAAGTYSGPYTVTVNYQ